MGYNHYSGGKGGFELEHETFVGLAAAVSENYILHDKERLK